MLPYVLAASFSLLVYETVSQFSHFAIDGQISHLDFGC